MHGGVQITAYARRNLLELVRKLDDFVVYCDTDSIKLVQGYDKKIIEEYNENVKNKLKKISKSLGFDFSLYEPQDIKGRKRLIGIFENEGTYTEFKTLGAKKYAYRDSEGNLHITVSGVPKKGVVELKNDIRNFKDDLVFHHENTGKNIVQYNDNQEEFCLVDKYGNKQIVKEKYGVAILPTTYVLGRSEEYVNFIEESSGERSKYNERKIETND